VASHGVRRGICPRLIVVLDDGELRYELHAKRDTYVTSGLDVDGLLNRPGAGVFDIV
jgi:hypothetical protein